MLDEGLRMFSCWISVKGKLMNSQKEETNKQTISPTLKLLNQDTNEGKQDNNERQRGAEVKKELKKRMT